ncbi:MAG: mechanosensitive ion channel [Rhodospirillales bacterium]|nr:mechanosensitive ion channel [Rhodospirillales bacterium]MCB9964989.1 mechanosensitive ion channel [Rhodospirillales bacterium]MCB9973419.1 mechanosensitive ion channel [Rhodospirillales bacterium]MCB9980422.1 mechanosensitive ion channel [Rhodospirillales bacterium]
MTNDITSTVSAGDQTIDLSINNAESQSVPDDIPAVMDGPKMEDIIDVVQNPETLDTIFSTVEKFALHIFTWNVIIELTIIAGAICFGWLMRKVFRPHLEKMVSAVSVPYAMKRVMRNLIKLSLHITAVVVLLLSTVILVSIMPQWSIKILTAVTKLLTAWIFIRAIAQIIVNGFLRNIIASFAWIVAALSIVGGLEMTLSTLDSIGLTIGGTHITLLAVGKAVMLLTLLLAVAQFLSKVAEQRIRSSTSLTPSAQVLIGKVIKITLITFALLFGVTMAGIDLSAFAIFGGALGLGIGFGLQKVISNLFSGILLLADHSIKPGDIIEMPDGVFGWIGQLNARYVSIVTRDNKEYLVPNEDFITQPVINWSYTNRLIRIEISFGVHYKSDPHEVRRIAVEAIKNVPRVQEDPAPVCHLVEFGESSLNFVLRYWINDAEKGVTNTKGDVMLAVWDAFKENGIEIPYPHREVHLHQKDKSI